MKRLAAFLLVLSIIPLLAGCSGGEDILAGEILEVGKADCTILAQGGHTLILDCGEAEDADTILKALQSAGICQVDYLIITHFDKDHVGGAAALLENLPIGQVIQPDYTPSNPLSDAYTAYCKALQDTQVPVISLRDTWTQTLGTASVTVTGANGVTYDKNTDNNNSLLLSVTHAGNRLLFAGDVEKQRIETMLASGVEQYDFLKVPHHGVYNLALPELFQAVQMDYAVITCSDKNPPEDKTLEALEQVSAKVFLTSDGTVQLRSTADGLRVWIAG